MKMHPPYHVKFFPPTEDQCFEYLSNLELYVEVQAIEAATCGQTDDLWLALHNGKLTSSRFGKIMHH